ncbi:MAG: site-specific DNA-methyltransferase [Phycisphaerae bacterium]|nr:site-specific DNA-methyltransferase [Phycisphaerae bacterium]
MIRTAQNKERAPRNRTITLADGERDRFAQKLLQLTQPVSATELEDKTVNQDLFQVLDYLPLRFVDLLFVDPPYNLTKNFGAASFKEMNAEEYTSWFSSWFSPFLRVLKPTASIYICGDWRSSGVIQAIAEEHLVIQNRITWEREKGRGAKSNWKNCSEDIWFCTMSKHFYFNADAVRLKRRVIAPYRDANGNPKDWEQTENGEFRLTSPSNVWTDLTVPFWSMPENTDHPTQKPEKLLAKVLLASSREGDFVFDPFLGCGTTSVVAKKLGRHYCGVETDVQYCCLAEKRLEMAEVDQTIQGYSDGVFWERNTLAYQNGTSRNGKASNHQMTFCLGEGASTHEK